jgi:hypothetical protein
MATLPSAFCYNVVNTYCLEVVKLSTITVGFSYYQPRLKFKKDANHDGVPEVWDMTHFCEWILGKKGNKAKRPALSVPLPNEEFADLEWREADSKFDEQHNLYYFRLKKLRSSNLPAMATKDGESQNLQLEENQFLGEFNLIVFDPVNKLIIVQNNFFGLTQKKIQLALSSMRLRWKEDTNAQVDENNPGFVDLAFIPDDEALRAIGNDKIFRSVDVKSSDVEGLSEIDGERAPFLNKVLDLAKSIHGLSFNVKISLARAPKDQSLSDEETRALISDIQALYATMKDNKKNPVAQMSVGAKDSVDDPVENIDVLLPKLKSYCRIDDEQRSTLGAEFIYQQFLEQNYFSDDQHFQQRARTLTPRV